MYGNEARDRTSKCFLFIRKAFFIDLCTGKKNEGKMEENGGNCEKM